MQLKGCFGPHFTKVIVINNVQFEGDEIGYHGLDKRKMLEKCAECANDHYSGKAS